MRKILMRAPMNPLESIDSAKVIVNNLVCENSGNLLFAHSVMRTLMCEDTVIDTTLTNKEFTDEEVECFNKEYECFVIPLANAFRVSFQRELICIRHLVERLDIPCVVVGVGVQTGVDEDIEQEFEFDEEVIKFVKEVLKKSAMIGVRGETTAAYMKKLGFVEEKDYTVIGCPSMYMHGEQLELKEPKELTPESLVSVNRKIGISPKMHKFIAKSSRKFENYMFIPQGIDDLALLYKGVPINREKFPNIFKNYPWHTEHRIYANGHEIGFTNVSSWLEFLRTRDFSFGTRIHGNIAAVLAGIPTYIFVPDSRIMELAQYHNIPHMLTKDVEKKMDIFDIYDKADFSSVKRGHVERFHHYLDFLEWNGLQHVFGTERKNFVTPFDKELAKKKFDSGIEPITRISTVKQWERKLKWCYYNEKKKKEREQEEWNDAKDD